MLISANDRRTTRSGETFIPHHQSELGSMHLADLSLPSHVIITERRRGSIGRTLKRAESDVMDGIHAVARSIRRMSSGGRQGRRVRRTSRSGILFAGRRVNWKAATTVRVQMATNPPCQSILDSIRQNNEETASYNLMPKRGSGTLATGRRRVASRVARGRRSATSRNRNVS